MFIAGLPLYKKLSRNRSFAIADYILPLVDRQAHMLDFGAGNMYLAERLSGKLPGLKITGIDVVEDQNLDPALFEKFKNISFKKYPGKEIPFADKSFDCAVASAVMHHTPDPEYYLSELRRVVKQGGTIILVEEMYHHFLDKIFIMAEDFMVNKLKKGIPIPLTFRAYDHYQEEFKKLGLTVLFEGHVRPSFPWKHHYVFQLRVP